MQFKALKSLRRLLELDICTYTYCSSSVQSSNNCISYLLNKTFEKMLLSPHLMFLLWQLKLFITPHLDQLRLPRSEESRMIRVFVQTLIVAAVVVSVFSS